MTITTPDPGGLTSDLDELAPDLLDDRPGAVSGMSLLRRAAERSVAREDVRYTVPGRPGMAARYTLDGLTPELLQSVNRRAAKKGEVDSDTVHALILAEQCIGLEVDGQPVTEDGRPLRFGSSMVREALGVNTAADAVRVWYGGPTKNYGFALQHHASRLLIAAGFGDDGASDDVDDDEDPSTAAR